MDAETLERLRQYRNKMEENMESLQKELESGKYRPEGFIYKGKSARASILCGYLQDLDTLFPELAQPDSTSSHPPSGKGL